MFLISKIKIIFPTETGKRETTLMKFIGGKNYVKEATLKKKEILKIVFTKIMGGQKSLAVLMSLMGGLDYENEATLELPIMSSLRAGNDDK